MRKLIKKITEIKIKKWREMDYSHRPLESRAMHSGTLMRLSCAQREDREEEIGIL